LERAAIKPMVVQNRCFANRGWDREVREICVENSIMYQGFSLLTANVSVLQSATIRSLATKLGVDTMQVILRFAMQVGMVPLTGTSNEEHMRQDLGIYRILLSDEEVALIESIAG
jgi:diketogulonate reductase-like aldo/keto reductase